MEVRLQQVTSSGAGAVVATDITAADGSFSLATGSDDEYYIRVVAGRYQGGWIGSKYVERRIDDAITHAPGATLGKIWAHPAFMRGVVVNASTGNPVKGVVATARNTADPSSLEGDHYTTNRNGFSEITGITGEDSNNLKLNGSSQGYETGFRGCSAQVVPTWGAACGAPLGRIGKVFLDKL